MHMILSFCITHKMNDFAMKSISQGDQKNLFLPEILILLSLKDMA